MFVWLTYFLVFWLGLYTLFFWLMYEGYSDLRLLHGPMYKFRLFDEIEFFLILYFPGLVAFEMLILLSRMWTTKTYKSFWDLSWDHALKGRRGNLCSTFSTDALLEDNEKHLPDTTILIAAYVDAETSILEKVLNWYGRIYPETPLILSCNYRNKDKYLGWITSLKEEYDRKTDTKIKVLINPSSTSKADNLNAAVPHIMTKYIYCLDCGVYADGTITDYVHLIESGKYKVLQGIKMYSWKKSESLYSAWVAQRNSIGVYTFHRMTSELFSSGFFVGSNVLLETTTAASIRWEACIAEDQVYTIQLNYNGHKAIQVPVFALEDAPETTDNAFKQQFRWFRSNFLLTFRREFWLTRKVFPVNSVWSFGPWIAAILYFFTMCGKTLQWALLFKHFTIGKLFTMVICEVLLDYWDLFLQICISLRPMSFKSVAHHLLFTLKALPFNLIANTCWIFFFLIYSGLSNLNPKLRNTWHSSGVKRPLGETENRSHLAGTSKNMDPDVE